MALGPTACHIGEHGQHRYFIIIIPKNKRIMPEKDETESNDYQATSEEAEEI